MSKRILYQNVTPPARLKEACSMRSFYVPDTPVGHKVANLLHDFLAREEHEALFKVAQDNDLEDLAEAYLELQRAESDAEPDDKESGDDDDDDDDDDEQGDKEGDDDDSTLFMLPE